MVKLIVSSWSEHSRKIGSIDFWFLHPYFFKFVMILAVDASNLRLGGGVTHLCELLNVARPKSHEFTAIHVWGEPETLEKLPSFSWLIKREINNKSNSTIKRLYLRFISIPYQINKSSCDVVFVPGGSFSPLHSKPVVTMSRNMLPFEVKELFRFRFSLILVKLILLRFFLLSSMSRSQGMIFMSNYAQKKLNRYFNSSKIISTVIPHGVSKRFFESRGKRNQTKKFSSRSVIQLLYVSSVFPYKHHFNVIKAVELVRSLVNLDVQLLLVGGESKAELKTLEKIMKRFDPNEIWCSRTGYISHNEMVNIYNFADIGIFASTCENFPNILIEKMAAGLPCIVSNYGPMPEIAKNAVLYFDPLKPHDLCQNILKLIEDPSLQEALSKASQIIANQFSWHHCARDTFAFLKHIMYQNEIM